MGYGLGSSPYEETKTSFNDEDIGPLVQTFLTRCIQCTRCVRFGQEIAGIRELAMTSRGEDSEIKTFIKHTLTSEVSANIIDLCPVGALTSKPFLYKARAWELDQAASIAPHDCYGSNIYLHTRRDEVMRVVPHKNEQINGIWLSDRDRFSYTAIQHPDRLQSPMIKRNGQWVATDWETALEFVVQGFRAAQETHGAQTTLTLSSPNATLEEYYLLCKLCDTLGCPDISYHLRDIDLADQDLLPEPHFGINIADIEQQKAILLVGTEIMRELPLLGLRLRKASLAGAEIDAINPADFAFNFPLTDNIIYQGDAAVAELASILRVLLEKNTDATWLAFNALPLVQSANVTAKHRNIAARLQQNTSSFIYLGALSFHSAQASTLRLLTASIAELTNSQWGMHTDGSNNTGLARIQQLFKLKPKSLTEIIDAANHKAILLHNLEPELDCANPYGINQLLKQAEIVVACSAFKSNYLLRTAHVLLPIATLGETSGSFVNLESTLQSFKGYVSPRGAARPAWRVFCVLARLFGMNEFTYTSTQDALEELHTQVNFDKISFTFNPQAILDHLKQIAPISPSPLAADEFYRITQWPIYKIDSLVRRAQPLQNSATATTAGIYLNSNSLKRLGLAAETLACAKQNGLARLPLILDDRLADNTVCIPAGFDETSDLSGSFAQVRIYKESNV
jgi:NADH-quinone oxidoreductase subunit G